MGASGASRLVLSESQLENDSTEERNKAFENENEEAKSIKKIPLKNPSEHNHSK